MFSTGNLEAAQEEDANESCGHCQRLGSFRRTKVRHVHAQVALLYVVVSSASSASRLSSSRGILGTPIYPVRTLSQAVDTMLRELPLVRYTSTIFYLLSAIGRGRRRAPRARFGVCYQSGIAQVFHRGHSNN